METARQGASGSKSHPSEAVASPAQGRSVATFSPSIHGMGNAVEILAAPATVRSPNGPSRVRRRLCIVTVLACAPYLALKILWIVGVGIGVNGSTFLDDSRAANVGTAFLDLCAAGLAVLFVHPMGRRIPALLVGVPTWIATGLLGPLVCGLIVGVPVQYLSGGGSAMVDDGGLNAWTFAVVYSGFVVQGLLLAPAFVLYARDRWPALFVGRQEVVAPVDALVTLRRILEGAFVIGGAAFVGQYLHNAIAGGGLFPHPSTTQRVAQLSFAALAAAGVAAYVHLWRRRPQTRTLLAVGWIGTGVVFTESLVLVTGLVARGPSDDRV